MPYLLLTFLVSGFQNHPKDLLFPGLWCWAHHLYLHPRPIIILCDFNSHSIHSGPLRKTLRSFRDPASPSQSSPKSPLALGRPWKPPRITLPSFTSSFHPPFSLTVCLFFDLSERNEGSRAI